METKIFAQFGLQLIGRENFFLFTISAAVIPFGGHRSLSFINTPMLGM